MVVKVDEVTVQGEFSPAEELDAGQDLDQDPSNTGMRQLTKDGLHEQGNPETSSIMTAASQKLDQAVQPDGELKYAVTAFGGAIRLNVYEENQPDGKHWDFEVKGVAGVEQHVTLLTAFSQNRNHSYKDSRCITLNDDHRSHVFNDVNKGTHVVVLREIDGESQFDKCYYREVDD